MGYTLTIAIALELCLLVAEHIVVKHVDDVVLVEISVV